MTSAPAHPASHVGARFPALALGCDVAAPTSDVYNPESVVEPVRARTAADCGSSHDRGAVPAALLCSPLSATRDEVDGRRLQPRNALITGPTDSNPTVAQPGQVVAWRCNRHAASLVRPTSAIRCSRNTDSIWRACPKLNSRGSVPSVEGA